MKKKLACFLLLLLMGISACSPVSTARKVVIYTSVDQIYAEPILDAFEQESGIEVQAVYDVEAAKTTGLVNRLLAEKDAPRADVWWNSEIMQTLALKEAGVLMPYPSAALDVLPALFRDAEGYWGGVGGRARVLLVNTDLVENPASINSLANLSHESWAGEQVGIAYPIFGTTATHAAALYAYWGEEKAWDFFTTLAAHDVNVVDGNSVVRDLVGNGTLAFGLTDTDDACGGLLRGDPVSINFPDQDGMGTLVIPGSVAQIANSPHPEEARLLLDYLLSVEVEQKLVDAGFSHIPLHPEIAPPTSCISTQNIKAMDVDYAQVYRFMEISQTELREIFLR